LLGFLFFLVEEDEEKKDVQTHGINAKCAFLPLINVKLFNDFVLFGEISLQNEYTVNIERILTSLTY